MDAGSVPTVFGSINSIIDQTTNSILKIESAQNTLKGQSPSPTYGAFGSLLNLPKYTTTQWIGLGLIVLVASAMVYILYWEFK
jgi:hypothetical protein